MKIDNYKRKILNQLSEITSTDYTNDPTIEDVFNGIEELIYIYEKTIEEQKEKEEILAENYIITPINDYE